MKYLAYGSNISETRLKKRISGYKRLQNIELPGYTINFSKQSKDGSGKATLVENKNESVFCVLYEIGNDDFKKLDIIEGLGYGYNKIIIDGFITYIADKNYIDLTKKPYDWYLYLIIDGMIENKFPENYVKNFFDIETLKDMNRERAFENYAKLKNFNMRLDLNVVYGIELQLFETQNYMI